MSFVFRFLPLLVNAAATFGARLLSMVIPTQCPKISVMLTPTRDNVVNVSSLLWASRARIVTDMRAPVAISLQDTLACSVPVLRQWLMPA